MGSSALFFSLRWKFAILFGGLFLILQSVFVYLSYVNAQQNFEKERAGIRRNHVNIAHTLTNDSFLILEQFADLVSMVGESAENLQNGHSRTIKSLNENWTRWQLIWDIESIAFFDKHGGRVKSWGKELIDADATVRHVLEQEMPEHKIFCPDNCFQQANIPVLGHSKITGVFSIMRSFADVIIKYHEATEADLGILIAVRKNKLPSVGGDDAGWHFKLSGMTRPDRNMRVYDFITTHYQADEFYNTSRRVEFEQAIFEVSILPIEVKNAQNAPPYFLFINDITAEIGSLNADLKRNWYFSFIGLAISLLLILFTSHVSFRRITKLSRALPLLSKYRFREFRELMAFRNTANVAGYDELDNLRESAVGLADQLEFLEQEMRGHTFNLLEKSQELAKERDFIKQLVELAPILIVLQKQNGIILSINHAGAEAFESESRALIGKVFDLFLPEADQEHFKKLNRLRAGELGSQFQIDGLLVTETGRFRDISWFHKLLPSKQYGDEKIVLTLGLDISERKLAEARNIRMAYYDYLTGLSNRRKFQEEFAQKLASANRYGYQLALFYLDLDRFKEINDTSGHEAGDMFLKMVAKELKETMRSTDLLSRLGGDEFTLLMPHADLQGVEHIARKINIVLKSLIFNYSGKTYTASASIGIAIYPLHGETVNELMANADLAMYKAKELGRGQHHMFNPQFDYRKKLNQTIRWRTLLDDAITNDKFVLAYQPILDIKTNEVSRYECLVRLKQDDGQLMLPKEFVYKAEELGIVGKIDRLVLKKALQQHIEFNRQGKKYKLSVNISRRSFEDPSILEDFAALFNHPEVDRERIIFEVTDTVSISNNQVIESLIEKIRPLGCVFALNDFGVEYPSLQYIKNAPIDYVKIEGSLIRQIDKNADDKAFVKTLIEIAQSLGKKTVAEFVESEAVLIILKEIGIDYAQGYYIGKPESLE